MTRKDILQQKNFLEKIVSYGIILLFFILPILYIPGLAGSYVTAKEYVLIGFADTLTIFWVWLLFRDTRYRLSKKNLLFLSPLVLFLLSMTISGIAGIDPQTSFFSTIESGTGLVLLWHIALIVCIIASLVRAQGKSLVRQLMQVIFLSGVVLAVATYFASSALFNIDSPMLNGSSGGAMMGNVLLAGAYLLFSVFFGISLFIQESSGKKKLLYAIGLLIILFSPSFFNSAIFAGTVSIHSMVHSPALLFGGARMATISLAVGAIVAFFLWLAISAKKKILKIAGIAGLICVTFGIFFAVWQISLPATPIHSYFIEQSGNRTTDWQEALEGIKQKPILGWGFENYRIVQQQYLNPIVYNPGHGDEVWAVHPHASFLEILVNGGIVGSVFYVAIIFGLIFGIITSYKQQKVSASMCALFFGLLFSYLLQNQLIFDSSVSYLLFFSLLGIVAGLIDTVDYKKSVSQSMTSQQQIIGWGSILFFLFLFIYLALLPLLKVRAYQYITTETSDVRTGQYQALFHSGTSYAIDTDISFYADTLYFSYSKIETTLKANPLYKTVATKEVQALIDAIAPIWQTRQYDYHLSLSLVHLENLELYLTGDTSQVRLAVIKTYADAAFKYSPTDPQIYVAYAETENDTHDTADAIALLQKAVALNPYYAPATSFLKSLQTN